MHANKNPRNGWITIWLGISKRKGRAIIIQHPTITTGIRIRRIEIKINRAAKIDPTNKSKFIFMRKWRPFRTRWWTHHAVVIKICKITIGWSVDNRLPLPHKSACISWGSLGGEIIIGPTISALPHDFPSEQASTGLKLANITRGVGLPPFTIMNDRLVAKLCMAIMR